MCWKMQLHEEDPTSQLVPPSVGEQWTTAQFSPKAKLHLQSVCGYYKKMAAWSGIWCSSIVKGVFIDGHERSDVFESRVNFLRKMTEWGFVCSPTEEAAQALPADVPHMTQEEGEKSIMWFHDESACNTTEDTPTLWGEQGKLPIKPKKKVRLLRRKIVICTGQYEFEVTNSDQHIKKSALVKFWDWWASWRRLEQWSFHGTGCQSCEDSLSQVSIITRLPPHLVGDHLVHLQRKVGCRWSHETDARHIIAWSHRHIWSCHLPY